MKYLLLSFLLLGCDNPFNVPQKTVYNAEVCDLKHCTILHRFPTMDKCHNFISVMKQLAKGTHSFVVLGCQEVHE